MKTSHFEGSVALRAAKAAQGRDESTQSELAACDYTSGRGRHVGAGHCPASLASTVARWPSIWHWLRPTPPWRPPARRVSWLPNPPLRPPGRKWLLIQNRPLSTLGSGSGRPSLCATWQAQIEAALEVGRTAQWIYQELVGAAHCPGTGIHARPATVSASGGTNTGQSAHQLIPKEKESLQTTPFPASHHHLPPVGFG